MSVERLYEELYEIAKHVGPLDANAVGGATMILAHPRYANDPNPAGLLVEDLKQVIATIAADVHPEREPEQESASRYFQRYARRFFSLEATGEQIDHRRSFGNTRKTGTIFTWMNRGVIFRVAAGLLELWAETSASPAPSTLVAGRGYRITSVRVTRQLGPRGRGVVLDQIEYDIDVLEPDPQVLLVPFRRRFTAVGSYTDSEIVHPPPQRVAVTMHRKRFTAVVFGAHKPGAHVRLDVRHVSYRARCPPQAFFPIEQPIDELILRVERRKRPVEQLQWAAASMTLLGERTVLDQVTSNPWGCMNPTVGLGYELAGYSSSRTDDPLRPETIEPDSAVA